MNRTAFAYEAQTPDGQIFQGTLQAQSAADVVARLASLHLRVVSVQPAPSEKKRAASALPADDFLIFNQQLAHLTEAGMPVERGLRLIAIDMRSGRLAHAANQVADELERGIPLQDAFAAHAASFPPLYGQLVQAGASSGNLPGMLFNLGKHLELVGRLRRSLWRTLTYPLMILAALTLVFLFISIYVLPTFSSIFSDFRVRLPVVTTFMIEVAHIYPWIFGMGWASVLALVLFDTISRASGARGIPWLSILGGFPLIGGLLKANILARWVDALRLGIDSGLDLPAALQLAASAIGYGPLQRDASALADHASRGLPLTFCTLRFIPPTIPAAIQLASTSGAGSDLATVLHTLSSMYEQQTEHRLRMLPSVLTPLLLLFIVSGVALTVLSMFLPLIRLIQSVSGGEYDGG